jgi:hypothetical protein
MSAKSDILLDCGYYTQVCAPESSNASEYLRCCGTALAIFTHNAPTRAKFTGVLDAPPCRVSPSLDREEASWASYAIGVYSVGRL